MDKWARGIGVMILTEKKEVRGQKRELRDLMIQSKRQEKYQMKKKEEWKTPLPLLISKGELLNAEDPHNRLHKHKMWRKKDVTAMCEQIRGKVVLVRTTKTYEE